MGPKVMFTFDRPVNRGDIPTMFRAVDKAGTFGSSDPDDTNVVIERFDGYDAMGQQRWIKAGPEGIRAMLNELIYFTVTRNEPAAEAAA